MYGNHSSHPSGFQSPEMISGGYSYFQPHHHPHLHHLSQTETGYSHSTTNNTLVSAPITTTSSNNSSSTTTSSYTHPHLFSPSALEYGITTTSTSNNSPTDAYYDNDSGHSYYNSTSGPSPNAIQDHHIISTDNGMSYTNLDYTMYNQHNSSGYLQTDDKSTISHYSIGDEMILSSGQPNQNTPSNWHHHHSGYLDSSISMSLTGLNAQNQMGHAVVNSVQSSSPGIQHQNQQQHQQQQQQQNLQTYKWMQVKRNVPKPQGKFLFNFKSGTIFFRYHELICTIAIPITNVYIHLEFI